MKNWRDISYLAKGNPRQREVYHLILDNQILESLRDFDPAVVSTICVGLDIEGSDVDIICQTGDFSLFKKTLNDSFSNNKGFRCGLAQNKQAVVCSFQLGGLEIEIYGSAQPVEEQNAYRHLTVMSRLVSIGGEEFRARLRELKSAGLKTEPSIAKLLKLHGDPYEAVLGLESKTEAKLKGLIVMPLRALMRERVED